MGWDVHVNPQPGCRHGDGMWEAVRVRVPVFSSPCPHCGGGPNARYDVNPQGNPLLEAVCSICRQRVKPSSIQTTLDPLDGTMVYDGPFVSAGMTNAIWKCLICGARYSSSQAFGAQSTSPFCGTEGNIWK